MKTVIVTICLIGSVFANPILHNVLVSNEQDSNSTESLSVSQSSENTSELQSSEEVASTNSTESESSESASEDKTSEESDSESDEVIEIDPMLETEDNSMGSEENVRKVSWVKAFSSVGHVLSAEDNTSREVEGHLEDASKELTHISLTADSRANLPLLHKRIDGIDSSSSDSTDLAAASSNSTESNSSESQESDETSDSSDASESSKESDESDSAESEQVKAKDCVNGTQSCESEEYFLQSVGDDAHFSVHGLMMPDEENRELSLRR
ncbi:secretory calcium-binding phosphoprotein 1 isoform X2 [Oryzias melastigma]|uniref:secretory calcium-binding phosphoprotein 1 isoform X2 n=1 Tax=Oryzias melastigma TaxID=30732 RepID=UPI000CF83C08|nr:secretory calcium-binding phosphoprotein 1 isoform X2 [Oryzias melastigma]